MPSKSDKQQRFFFAVKSCKEGGKCSKETKKVADEMSDTEIEHFTHIDKRKKKMKESLDEGYHYIIGMKKGKKRYINSKGKWSNENAVLKKFNNKASAKSFVTDNYLNQDGFDEILVQFKESLDEAKSKVCKQCGIKLSKLSRDEGFCVECATPIDESMKQSNIIKCLTILEGECDGE